ncbi:MAG: alpha/beta fold hydrolase [Sporichthyaceae bacterium]
MTSSVRDPQHWTALSWDEHVHVAELPGSPPLTYLDYGQGPPLVLLHGMACCWQWWLECLPRLGIHHRVLAIDLPGFGASAALPAGATMDDYADSVLALLELLKVERAVVAGHSMGGLAALSIARRRPDLVRRLVLVGAGGVPMSERRLAAVLAMLRRAERLMANPRFLHALATRPGFRRAALRTAMRDPRAMSQALAAQVVPAMNAPAFLDSVAASANAVTATRPEEISVPTTLIWGEHDVFAPVRTARDMLARLPHGELHVISRVGHSPMVEAPTRFTRLLLNAASDE